MKTFTAYVEWDPTSKMYVGIVPGIPRAHTQAATLDKLQTNLKEVLELCLEELGPTDLTMVWYQNKKGTWAGFPDGAVNQRRPVLL